MTMKRKTGHIMAVITPDIKASLSEPLMKPVVLGMPVMTQHDGRGLAKQMLDMQELYLGNVEEQVQSINTDGQYVHLNIKKHFQDLNSSFQVKSAWFFFQLGPSSQASSGLKRCY